MAESRFAPLLLVILAVYIPALNGGQNQDRVFSTRAQILPQQTNQALKFTNTTLSAPTSVSVGSTITFESNTRDSDGRLVLGGSIIMLLDQNGTWIPIPGCQGSVYNGSFTCTWTPLRARTFNVRAAYSGYRDTQANVEYQASSSEILQIEVGAIETSISVATLPEEASIDAQTLTATVQVTGSLTPAAGPPLSGVQVLLTFTLSQNTSVRDVMTDSSGHFSYQLRVDSVAADSTDKYSIVASWNGDSEHTAAFSQPAIFYVTKVKTEIELSVSESSVSRDILTGASPIKITGKIVPNVGSTQITINVIGPVSESQNVTTEPDGSFLWSFKPEQDGTYTLKVGFPGDRRHSLASSSPVTVEVAPSYNTVAIIGAVAAVAAVLALWRFGSKRARLKVTGLPLKRGMERAEVGLTCPRCGFVNRPTASFCIKDKTPLRPGMRLAEAANLRTCPNCRKKNRSDASFCRFCRTKLT